MSDSNASQQGIQSVEVAMKVLEAIERLGGPATLSAVAGEAGLRPSNTHRYLVSLTRVGLVDQSRSTGRYDLGAAARRLGIEAMRRSDDVGVAVAVASRLRDDTGHTVNVSAWSNSGPVILHWEQGRYPLPIVARVGSTLPIVDSSVGHVFLAHLPRAVTMPVLREQQRYHESSAATDEVIDTIAAGVRAEGLASTVGGIVPGVMVVAAPAFGPADALAVVLGCVVSSRVATRPVVRDVCRQLAAAAAALSAELGADVGRVIS